LSRHGDFKGAVAPLTPGGSFVENGNPADLMKREIEARALGH
jgi:hypothetical protein